MKTNQTAEHRTQLLTQLASQVESLKASDGWQRWLDFAANFRTYSLHNQLLILAQRPTAVKVAGYRTWQSLGRQVRKGEKGIAILAPSLRKVVDDETGEPNRVLTGFRVVFVFDVRQTEGEALPTMDLPPVTVSDEHLLDRLIVAASSVNIEVVTIGRATDGARGWWDPAERRITLVEDYPLASRTRTMLHELAHAHDPAVADLSSPTTRSERELVAESAAYIVGTGVLGVEMAEASAFYVATWGADHQRLTKLAAQVLAVAKRLETTITVSALV